MKIINSFFLLFLLLFPAVNAHCISEYTVNNLTAMNMSFLIDELEANCNKIQALSVKVETTSNKTDLVNSSFINSTFNLQSRIDSFNISLSNSLDKYDTFNDTLLNYNKTIEDKKLQLEDIFDSKYSDLENQFLTAKDYQDNNTIFRQEITNLVEMQISPLDRYVKYLFITIVIVVIGVILILRYKPNIIRKPLITDIRPETKSITELTTRSALKDKIDKMRGLKIKIARGKLDLKDKIELLKKVDNNEIWDDASLEKEIELMKSTRGLKDETL